MKNITLILILFGLLGIGQVDVQVKSQIQNLNSIKFENKFVEYIIEDTFPQIKLPEGFRLDTIQLNDIPRNLSIFMSFPISGITQFDKVIFDEINMQKNDFIVSLDIMIKEGNIDFDIGNSEFQAEPVSVFKDNKITSILYIVSFYHGGAPHPMTMYYSFNFDNNTYNRIFFSDYFEIKTSVDSTFIIKQITNAIGREGVFVYELNNIDFNIEQDTISFNFDDYEIASYAEGIIQGRIQKQKLTNNIKNKYR